MASKMNSLAKLLVDTLEQERFYGTVELVFEDGQVLIVDERRKMKEDRLLKRIKR